MQHVTQLYHYRIHNELPSEALLQRQIMEKYPSCPTIIGVNLEPVSSVAAPSPPVMRGEVCCAVFSQVGDGPRLSTMDG